jgi:hypothetical protein
MAWLSKAFNAAKQDNALGVVLMIQADMWDAEGTHATLDAFDPLVNAIGNDANAFGKPVLMLAGDSHVYAEDHPYDGSAFFISRHPDEPIAPNVQRIIVEGDNTVPDRFEYLRLTIDPKSENLFSWKRVDYSFQ